MVGHHTTCTTLRISARHTANRNQQRGFRPSRFKENQKIKIRYENVEARF